MSRQTARALYHELVSSEFNFVPSREVNLESVYVLVQAKFPNLCDDDYFCFENCRSGNRQAEWKHKVRSALQRLKSNNGRVRKQPQRGQWKFVDTAK